MNGATTAFWSMTINNPDETTLALVRSGYPDYMRELVWTQEQGEEGTPHIQAWIKLQRQQRMSFVKKLFPRGHFKPITTAEYDYNTKLYAQKKDETTRSAAVHTFNDPMVTVESVTKQVALRIINDAAPRTKPKGWEPRHIDTFRRIVEREMVTENFKMAKLFVSATYKQMWKQFGEEMVACIVNKQSEESEVDIPMTHTHTHTQPEKNISPEGYNHGIQQDEESGSEGEDSSQPSQEDSQGYDDGPGQADEDDTEGFSDGPSETDSPLWS